jgi:hypothetical protein
VRVKSDCARPGTSSSVTRPFKSPNSIGTHCALIASSAVLCAGCCPPRRTRSPAASACRAHARRRAPFRECFPPGSAGPLSHHPGAHALRQGLRHLAELRAFRRARLCRGGAGCARAVCIGGRLPAARTGAGRWRRHAQLDRAPALVGWQNRHAGRLLSGNRAVESGGAEQPAPESHLPGGLRLRRLSRPLLFAGRRHEAGPAPAVDVGKPARAAASIPTSASSCCICPCAPPTWRPPGRRSSMFQEAVAHPAYDSFWKSISVREQFDKIRVPVFSVGGWFDNFVESDLEAYERLRKRSGVDRILIGPWPHNKAARLRRRDFGPDADMPLRGIQMQWFDQFLKGKDTPLLSQAPVRVFVMGRTAGAMNGNGRRARIAERFYLESRGHANTLSGRWHAGPARLPIERQARATGSYSIRKIPCPPRAARPAAIRRCFPGGRRTSAPWSGAATCWCIPRLRCARTWK